MVETIRVLLADDHPLFRAGIAATIAEADDMAVVGQATTGGEVMPKCQALHPDVLLLDLSMPGMVPGELVAELQRECPDTCILVLSAFSEDVYVYQMMAAGVSGYLLKDEAAEMVVNAIRVVARGGTTFSQTILKRLNQAQSEGTDLLPIDMLSEREHEILSLLARGWDNAKIAGELHLAEQTVRNYTSRIYSKLQVTSRAEAIVWARDRGITGT